jgi:predicted N-acyltransferase
MGFRLWPSRAKGAGGKRPRSSSTDAPESIAPNALKAKVYSTILDVPREIWDGLVGGHSRTHSWAFWHSLEIGQLNDFTYYYVLFFDEADTPVALTCYYSITTDFAIFGSKKLKALLARIRRPFPRFFKMRILECGCPITLSSPPFVHRPGVSCEVLARSLDRLMLRTARANRHLLLVIRDFEDNALGWRPDFERCDYKFAESLPNTYMEIPWRTPDEYLRSMKSHYRSKLLRHLRDKESEGVRHVLVDDFAHLADELFQQWQVVHSHADEYQREVLTPAWYRDFSDGLGGESKVILLYQHEELVGHALLLRDHDMLRWLFFGRSSAGRDGLYIYAAYKVIETAIRLGAKKLEFGLTCYSTKLDLGAQPMRSELALKSSLRLLNPVVKRLLPLLNQVPQVQGKMIFKQ